MPSLTVSGEERKKKWRVASGLSGKGEAVPRNCGSCSATDEHRSYCHHRADGRVHRIVAGERGVAGASGWLVVDQDRCTTLDDGAAIGRRNDEGATNGDVRRRIGGGAADGRGGEVPGFYVAGGGALRGCAVKVGGAGGAGGSRGPGAVGCPLR